jgi:hypothetical protein
MTFSMTAMMSWSRVLRAAILEDWSTFDWNDELGDDWQDFTAAFLKEVVGAHDGE